MKAFLLAVCLTAIATSATPRGPGLPSIAASSRLRLSHRNFDPSQEEVQPV